MDDGASSDGLVSVPFKSIKSDLVTHLWFHLQTTMREIMEYIAVIVLPLPPFHTTHTHWYCAGVYSERWRRVGPLIQDTLGNPEITKDYISLLFESLRLSGDATVASARLRTASVVRLIVRKPSRGGWSFPPTVQEPVERSDALDLLVRLCRCGDMTGVRTALDAGAAVNGVGCDLNRIQWTPLRAAVFSKHADVVALLLSRGGDPNGHKVMYSGVLNGTPDIVQQLLDAGGDVNAESFGVRPLFVAAASADDAVVRVLLSHPALDVSVTVEGKTAEECARERGRTAVADMIRDEVRPPTPSRPRNENKDPILALGDDIRYINFFR